MRVDSGLLSEAEWSAQHILLEMMMQDHKPEDHTAIRTDLGAIFVSLELSRSTWLVTSLSPGGGEKMSKHSVPGGDISGLLMLFSRLTERARKRAGEEFPIIAIQEAGLDGFWIHRTLEQEGIESHIVDAASIMTSRRRRRAKTDQIDGEALLRALMAYKRGEPRVCAMVRVPTPEDEDRRRISRERNVLIAERVAHVNRIKGLLFSQGIRYEPLRRDRRARLEELRTGGLFATDSNQSTHGGGQNNSSRIITVNPMTGSVTPFITNLPTGDHPTEKLAFSGGWIYWSQGSTTNSGVVGLDNNGGANQSDIPCQDITLSDNVFVSSLSPPVATSGYSPFGKQQPGAVIPAFFNSFTGQVRQGVCDGAILRSLLNDSTHAIVPFSWGYRNPYAIRFPPADHPLTGGLLVGVDGEDERGARPTNNAPERLELARQNPDGSPDYHGWPDRFGFLPSSQAVFNPIGGGADDLCQSP